MITASESAAYVGLTASPITLPYNVTVDGNGNVTEYVDANGAVKAHYEYGPFGEISASSGDKRDDFTHRFSTKPYERETKIVQYELRDYSPELGRWVSRDPIEERGLLHVVAKRDLWRLSLSLSENDLLYLLVASDPSSDFAHQPMYLFVKNEPVSTFDMFGLLEAQSVGTAYHATKKWWHASITINGQGYGFGPDYTLSGYWSGGRKVGRTTLPDWWNTSEPRNESDVWFYPYKYRSLRYTQDGKTVTRPCSCVKSLDEITACADAYKKAWDYTKYNLVSVIAGGKNCRDYVKTIMDRCCLGSKKEEY